MADESFNSLQIFKINLSSTSALFDLAIPEPICSKKRHKDRTFQAGGFCPFFLLPVSDPSLLQKELFRGPLIGQYDVNNTISGGCRKSILLTGS